MLAYLHHITIYSYVKNMTDIINSNMFISQISSRYHMLYPNNGPKGEYYITSNIYICIYIYIYVYIYTYICYVIKRKTMAVISPYTYIDTQIV